MLLLPQAARIAAAEEFALAFLTAARQKKLLRELLRRSDRGAEQKVPKRDVLRDTSNKPADTSALKVHGRERHVTAAANAWPPSRACVPVKTLAIRMPAFSAGVSQAHVHNSSNHPALTRCRCSVM